MHLTKKLQGNAERICHYAAFGTSRVNLNDARYFASRC